MAQKIGCGSGFTAAAFCFPAAGVGIPLADRRIALPDGKSACDFLRGEFAHSPRFLMPLFGGTDTLRRPRLPGALLLAVLENGI